MQKQFNLQKDDYKVIAIVKKYIRQVLTKLHPTPQQIAGIGNFLYAIEQLPEITEGANTYIQLSHTTGNNDFWEMKSFGFTINEDIFHIDVSGYKHNTYGGDSIGYPGWYIEAGGGRNTDAVIWELEDEISLMIHLEAELQVDDFSEIEYEKD